MGADGTVTFGREGRTVHTKFVQELYTLLNIFSLEQKNGKTTFQQLASSHTSFPPLGASHQANNSIRSMGSWQGKQQDLRTSNSLITIIIGSSEVTGSAVRQPKLLGLSEVGRGQQRYHTCHQVIIQRHQMMPFLYAKKAVMLGNRYPPINYNFNWTLEQGQKSQQP